MKKDVTERIEICKDFQNEIKDIITSNEGFVNITKQEEKYYSRIVYNLYSACLKKFEKTIANFNLEQSNVSEYIKNSIVRDAEMLLDKKLTDTEKEDIIDNPELVQELLKSKLEGQAHTTLVNKVNELSARHEDILKLEKSVNQVYQLFVDLQELVRQQGEVIDNIEANIAEAKDCVIKAEEDISQSYVNLKSARKKKCIVLIVLIILICCVFGGVISFAL